MENKSTKKGELSFLGKVVTIIAICLVLVLPIFLLDYLFQWITTLIPGDDKNVKTDMYYIFFGIIIIIFMIRSTLKLEFRGKHGVIAKGKRTIIPNILFIMGMLAVVIHSASDLFLTSLMYIK